MNETQILAWIVGGLGSAITIAGTWAWNHTHKLIADTNMEVDKKADKDEMLTQRRHVERIYDNLKTIEVSAAHIHEQMARVTSDMESEKRTRANATNAIMEELRSIRSSVVGYGRRPGDAP